MGRVNQKREFTFNYAGKDVTIETGRLAKQADGAVLVTSGDTQVLVTVCSARKMKEGQDFFPLLVEYTEKFYAAGKFLGGFMKREGRPSVQETLNARLIDRPLRPLFPEGYLFETVVSCTVLSYGANGDPEILAALGASAALSLSDIPFAGPVATIKVGRIGGEFVANLDREKWAESDLELVVAAREGGILMVEGQANHLSEEEVLEAIDYAHGHIQGFCQFIGGMAKELGRPKRPFEKDQTSIEKIVQKVRQEHAPKIRTALDISSKRDRTLAIGALERELAQMFQQSPQDYGGPEGGANWSLLAHEAMDHLLYEFMRSDILEKDKRIGGRKLNEIRPIEVEVDVLGIPHGSALFTRGETQVLSTVTLGGKAGEQMSDRIVGTNYHGFYLHYNFPPFCVGEARGVRGVGRREQGHGNLAERALKAVLPPPEKDYPYTTRIVCDVLESNGSSSMASVCAGSLAMMDAGVPTTDMVAGIAMGLVCEGDNFKILSDILGDEDHLGDMDFKIAGTKRGITAIQMDIKISGLTPEVMKEAMGQAREGRLWILSEMEKVLATPRVELKKHVPKIELFKIKPDQIGLLIGPGGKTIKKIQETFDVNLDIDEDGTVKVLGEHRPRMRECIDHCLLSIEGPRVGEVYSSTVVSVKEYGAFVDLVPGVSGLVHISEFCDGRVKDPGDYVSEGDEIEVKLLEIDRMGRYKFSAKEVRPLNPKKSS